MHRRDLTKPDGRRLILYAREPLTDDFAAPMPGGDPYAPNPHLRWHPLRGEWVAYAGHRQHRTFLPPAEFNPLAITRDSRDPTELPAGAWEVAVFENLFPTLAISAHDPPGLDVPTAPAIGACEVVVFTQDANATLGRLSLRQLELVVDVWADRYEELGAREEIAYVFPFENRGVEVGVTLHHPHGQIYAYPFVPPIPARELEQQRRHWERTGRSLVEEMVEHEIEGRLRILYDGPHTAAFLPICARYTYEVWVAPKRAAPSFAALAPDERRDFARALKTVLLKYDGLWNTPFPYVLVFHQAPTDGLVHPEAHLHAEFYPAYRMRDRLKYLAGSELGAGVFTADSVPEDAARQLQAVSVNVDA
jgi:UDPglucose--hexose-1-phosphate uridylyltransferase